jgi:hypothetical protein
MNVLLHMRSQMHRDVLGTLVLSILVGHNRYANISSIRFDGVNPGLLGMEKVVRVNMPYG